MELQEEIKSHAEAALPDPSVFVVSVKIVASGKEKVVGIYLDGDEGVSIDQCAIVSRKVGAVLEEKELMQTAYRLEVSSPGADEPIQHLRQLPKHVGRRLALKLANGEELQGALTGLDGEVLSIDSELKKKGKKKPEIESVSIPYTEVAEARILLAF